MNECNHIAFCPFYEETTEDGVKTVICKEKDCPMYPKSTEERKSNE